MKTVEIPFDYPLLCGIPIVGGVVLCATSVIAFFRGNHENILLSILILSIVVLVMTLIGAGKALWEIYEYKKALRQFNAAYLSFERLYNYVSTTDPGYDYLVNLYAKSGKLLDKHLKWRLGHYKQDHWDMSYKLASVAAELRHGIKRMNATT